MLVPATEEAWRLSVGWWGWGEAWLSSVRLMIVQSAESLLSVEVRRTAQISWRQDAENQWIQITTVRLRTNAT